MTSVPVLVYSDAPELNSGLARITRSLADLLTRMPEFRVGTFGRGGWGSASLPWVQYHWPENAPMQHMWGQDRFQQVCENFFRGGSGVLFTIMDPSRIHWITRPQTSLKPSHLRTFLEKRTFQVWGYLPVDSTGPHGRLSSYCADAAAGVDRPLAYSMWGAQVLEATLGKAVEWMPHGLNMTTFQPRDGAAVRVGFGLGKEAVVIGTVATNQTRKDWGVATAAIARLRERVPSLVWWLQVDEADRYWNLHALIADFGLQDCVLLQEGSGQSDEDLSYMYSMCDLTFLPTLGEGMGYPIVESLACGVPCVTTNYAGGVELTPNKGWLVEPVAWRLDGPYNQVRPVTNAQDWADVMLRVLEENVSVEECRAAVDHLNWPNIAEPWKRWLLGGIR